MGKNLKFILIIFIILLVGIGAGAYWFGLRQGEEKGRAAVVQEQEELQGKITAQAELKTMENLPETNPFKEVETNPFKEGYENPFK